MTGKDVKIEAEKIPSTIKGLLGKRHRESKEDGIVSKVEEIPQQEIISFDEIKPQPEERKDGLPLSVKQRFALPKGVERILEGTKHKSKAVSKQVDPE